MLKSDDIYSKWATSFSSEQATFAFTLRRSNCNFYYPFSNSCQTKVWSQNSDTAVSSPQSSGSRCQGRSTPGWPGCHPHQQPTSWGTEGKLPKSAQYPGAAWKKRTFPSLEGEGDPREAWSKTRTLELWVSKSKGERNSTARISCPGRAGGPMPVPPPARQMDT